jgi:hypothetical protein
MNETSQQVLSEDQDFNETYADVEAALADIDPLDREALNERVLHILDDIHSGRF